MSVNSDVIGVGSSKMMKSFRLLQLQDHQGTIIVTKGSLSRQYNTLLYHVISVLQCYDVILLAIASREQEGGGGIKNPEPISPFAEWLILCTETIGHVSLGWAMAITRLIPQISPQSIKMLCSPDPLDWIFLTLSPPNFCIRLHNPVPSVQLSYQSYTQ